MLRGTRWLMMVVLSLVAGTAAAGCRSTEETYPSYGSPPPYASDSGGHCSSCQ